MRCLRAQGVDRVVFCGKFQRPPLASLIPDRWALGFLARIGGRLLSDNRLIEAVVKEIESEGFSVIGPADVAASLLAKSGPYGRLIPTAGDNEAIALGFAAARGAGRRDLGQAAVVREGRIVDLEGPDGTDALIERCALRQEGGAGAILVKARKPIRPERTTEIGNVQNNCISNVPHGTVLFWRNDPDTPCLANFRLCLRHEFPGEAAIRCFLQRTLNVER